SKGLRQIARTIEQRTGIERRTARAHTSQSTLDVDARVLGLPHGIVRLHERTKLLGKAAARRAGAAKAVAGAGRFEHDWQDDYEEEERERCASRSVETANSTLHRAGHRDSTR